MKGSEGSVFAFRVQNNSSRDVRKHRCQPGEGKLQKYGNAPWMMDFVKIVSLMDAVNDYDITNFVKIAIVFKIR